MAAVMPPRYSAEDFETRSIHSVAPSYISEAPSYHSHHHEPIPPYTPRNTSTSRNNSASSEQPQQYGLPPIPAAPPSHGPNLNNFRTPTWSTHNNPAARQYRSVIERRAAARSSGMNDRWMSGGPSTSPTASAGVVESTGGSGSRTPRPLEDPYLVGEQAAAEARRERLRRENGDEILIREDKQWDWLLAQMSSWDQREKSWQKYHREAVQRGQRRSLLHNVRGRLRS